MSMTSQQKAISYRQADRVYSVDVHGNQVVLPPLCTCCLSPTDKKEQVSYTSRSKRGFVVTQRTISINMPICDDCLRHRAKFKRKLFWMGAWSVLVGVAAMILAMAGFYLDVAVSFFIGFGVSIVLFFSLAVVKKTKPLDSQHSTRLNSVRIVPLLSSSHGSPYQTTYTFTNQLYATIFRAANANIADPVQTSVKLNSAKKTHVIRIMENKAFNVFCILFVTMLFAFVVNNLNDSGTFRSLHLNQMLRRTGFAISTPYRPAKTTGRTTSALPTERSTSQTVLMPTVKPSANPTADPSVAMQYSAVSKIGDYVYVQVVSMQPTIAIGIENGDRTDIVCECKSPSGGKLWVIVPIAAYNKYFDSATDLTNAASAVYKSVIFDSPINIYGYLRSTNDECRALQKVTSSSSIISFVSINQANVPESDYKAGNVRKVPAAVSATNGMIFISPGYKSVCPFTIIADSSTDYYVYLKYQRAPASTTENRLLKSGLVAPIESDVAFYLKAGQQVKIQVPIGVYKLYYATGSVFYGTKLLFGDSTCFYQADDELSFYTDSMYYNGHTITLKSTFNGNFDTDPITESQFPTR